MGIPRVLARLEDGIFEGLPNEVAKDFPLRFLNAVKVGSDLSLVAPKFMHWMLVDPEHGIIKFAKNDDRKQKIQDVADLYQRIINGEKIDLNNAVAMRRAAYAADAADAAYAASAASYWKSREKARVIQADKLIELIEAA